MKRGERDPQDACRVCSACSDTLTPRRDVELEEASPKATVEKHWTGAHREPVLHAELLIDCEEDRTLRAVLVGMLREAER
jgi:hypothetical protein